MKISSMAFIAGHQVFRHPFSGSFKNLYNKFCPLLHTNIINESIAAPNCPTDNPAYSSYLSAWSVQSMYGVQQWFRLLAKISQHVNLNAIFSHDVLRSLIQRYSQANMATHLIPIVFSRGDFAEVRFITFNEYITAKHLNANQFVSHIGQLVLFGLTADPDTVNALRLTTCIAGYVKFRIKQGLVDQFFAISPLSHIYHTSSFDKPIHKSHRNSTELRTSHHVLNLLRDSKQTGKGEIVPNRTRLRALENHLRSVHSIGGSRSELKGLAKMGAFKKINNGFNNYLMKDNPNFDGYGLGRYEEEVSPYTNDAPSYEYLDASGQFDRRPKHQLLFGGYGANGEIPKARELNNQQLFDIRIPPLDLNHLNPVAVNPVQFMQQQPVGDDGRGVNKGPNDYNMNEDMDMGDDLAGGGDDDVIVNNAAQPQLVDPQHGQPNYGLVPQDALSGVVGSNPQVLPNNPEHAPDGLPQIPKPPGLPQIPKPPDIKSPEVVANKRSGAGSAGLSLSDQIAQAAAKRGAVNEASIKSSIQKNHADGPATLLNQLAQAVASRPKRGPVDDNAIKANMKKQKTDLNASGPRTVFDDLSASMNKRRAHIQDDEDTEDTEDWSSEPNTKENDERNKRGAKIIKSNKKFVGGQ